jgi:hypothetical protein
MRRLIFVLALCSALPGHSRALKNVTLTGWFSDERCAPARLTAAKLGPSNPDCSAECLRKGAAAVFIAESREILKVADYPGVLDDLGFHVEVTGALDPAAKILRVRSVKQLSWDGAACSRPKKPAKRE